MAYLGTQPNDVKKNTGLYTPSEILQLTKDGSWGGSLELIAEQTYSSGVSFVDFTSIQENKYDVHLLTYQDVMPDTNNVKPMQLQFFESGVLETASVYQYAQQYSYISGSAELKSTADTKIELAYEIGNTTPSSANGYCYMYNLKDSSKYSFITHHTVRGNTTTFTGAIFGGGVLPQTSTVDGFRLNMASGNYASFTMKLYGVKQ